MGLFSCFCEMLCDVKYSDAFTHAEWNSRRAAEVESVAVTVQIGIEPAEKSLR